jgi:hypothetical protein
MASIQLVTGPVARPGILSDLGGSATGAQLSADLHARYTMAAARGVLFHGSTAVAGVAPGTALSTTPPFALWNPPGSGKILSVIRSRLGYVSGTLGAGSIVYAWALQPTVPTGGAELPVVNALLGVANGAGRCWQGGTLANTPAIIEPAYAISAFLATTAIAPFSLAEDEIAGEIQVPAGACLVMQGVAAAGTTPLALFGCCWEEIPAVIST